MVQVDHDMGRRAFLDNPVEPLKFFGRDFAAGIACDAAIQTEQQPVANFFLGAVGKRRATAYWAHQIANIMIARHAVHAHIQWQEQIAEAIVGFCRVILNQITGDQHAVSVPITG